MKRSHFWTFFLLSGLALHEFSSSYLRTTFGGNNDFWSFLLGVAPNFISAALIFPFAGLTFRDALSKVQKNDSDMQLSRWFWGFQSVSQAGLLGWEFLQIDSNLIFDPFDLLFTILGAGAAWIFFILGKKFGKNVA